MEQSTQLTHHQPQQVSLTVREQLASMIYKRQTNSIISKCESNAVEELRSQFAPSQITAMFPTGLQSVIMGACPTIDTCAKVKSPMLGTLAQAYPAMADGFNRVDSPCITWMKAHLTEVSAFANVKEKMSDWQLDALCQQILADWPTLTMMEFILFCARMRSGLYESFYGSIDPMRILKSFRAFVSDRKYDYDRAERIERQEREERAMEEARRNAKGVDWIEEQVKNGKLLNVAKLFCIEIPEEYRKKDTEKKE